MHNPIIPPFARIAGVAVICAVVGVVMACQSPTLSPPEKPQEKQPDAPRPVAAPESHTKASDVSMPAEVTVEPRRAGQRDPFVFEPDQTPPVTIEERHLPDLASMTLVGIVTGTAVPKAMFTDASGYGHIIVEGARVADGRVTDIRDNEVVITLTANHTLHTYEGVEPMDKSRPTRSATHIIRLNGT
ncbi:MAG: hypothetical protein AAFS10_03695 [Myxococcota bacterium]